MGSGGHYGYRTHTPLEKVSEDLKRRYCEAAPIAAGRILRRPRVADIKLWEKDDLINEAFLHGNWWKYEDRDDDYLSYIIYWDMLKCVAVLEKDPLVRGYSAGDEKLRLKKKEDFCTRVDNLRVDDNLDEVENRDFRDYWRNNSKLNDSQLWLFDQLYVYGRSAKDIAEEIGVSKQSIYLRRKRLIEKIQYARRCHGTQ